MSIDERSGRLTTAPDATLRRWLDALVASDPGLQSLRRATRATLTVIGAVFTAALAVQAVRQAAPPTVPLFAGMIGLQTAVAVNDPSPRQRLLTLLLLAIMAIAVTTGATALAGSGLVVHLLLLALIFGAYYLRRFGPRYFALGLISFMALYFLTLVHATFDQLPWLAGAIVIGIGWAAVLGLLVLPEHPEAAGQRLLHSFYAAAARVLDLLWSVVQSEQRDRAWRQALQARLLRLNTRVVEIEAHLSDEVIDLRGRATHPDRLRVVLFDLLLAVETIARTTEDLVTGNQLGDDETARHAVAQVLAALRDAFRNRNIQAALPTIRRALETLAAVHATAAVTSGSEAPRARLLWRLGAGTRWIVDDIASWAELAAQPPGPAPSDGFARAEDAATASSPARADQPGGHPLAPTTIQAIQATAAGALSLYLGTLVSPDHPYWTLLAAFVVFSNATSVGKVYQRAFHRVLGTMLGALVGFWLATQVVHAPILTVILIFLCVFWAFYLFTRFYAAMVFFITIMLALMYGLLLGGVTPQLMAARVLDTLIGAGVGLVMSILIFPTYTSEEVRVSVRDFLDALAGYLARYLDDLAAERAPGQDPELIPRVLEVRKQFDQVRATVAVARRISGPQGRQNLDRLLTALMTAYHYAGQLASPAVRGQVLALDHERKGLVQNMKARLLANVEALRQAMEPGSSAIGLQPLENLDSLMDRGPASCETPSAQPSATAPLAWQAPAIETAPRSEVFASPRDPLRYLVRLDRALVELAAAYRSWQAG